jgi:hypothetical protein
LFAVLVGCGDDLLEFRPPFGIVCGGKRQGFLRDDEGPIFARPSVRQYKALVLADCRLAPGHFHQTRLVLFCNLVGQVPQRRRRQRPNQGARQQRHHYCRQWR